MSPKSNLWSEIGFRDNPYDTWPLGDDEHDLELLVGRTELLDGIVLDLGAKTSHIAVDAPNGGGKTSLIKCVMNELDSTATSQEVGQLLIPVRALIEPSRHENSTEFIERALLVLAETLHKNQRLINRVNGFSSKGLGELAKTMKRPRDGGVSGGVGIPPFGNVAAGKSSAANSSFPFRNSGFERLVQETLKEAFPAKPSGALVACIDNLELIGGPTKVQKFLGEIRDRLLRLPGVKWIVIGANGVLEGSNNHPRLSGVVSSPLELPELEPQQVVEVVERRIGFFRVGTRLTVPIGGESFREIYESCGRDLRRALQLSQDFSLEAYNRGMLDDDLLESTVEDGDEAWTRLELPSGAAAVFLQSHCLEEWDKVVSMGRVATGVLREVHRAGSIGRSKLIAEDRVREAAIERLSRRQYLVRVRNREDRRRTNLRLSGAGNLAITGGQLAETA